MGLLLHRFFDVFHGDLFSAHGEFFGGRCRRRQGNPKNEVGHYTRPSNEEEQEKKNPKNSGVDTEIGAQTPTYAAYMVVLGFAVKPLSHRPIGFPRSGRLVLSFRRGWLSIPKVFGLA